MYMYYTKLAIRNVCSNTMTRGTIVPISLGTIVPNYSFVKERHVRLMWLINHTTRTRARFSGWGILHPVTMNKPSLFFCLALHALLETFLQRVQVSM